jgi:predicted nucleic acid-binding protein
MPADRQAARAEQFEAYKLPSPVPRRRREGPARAVRCDSTSCAPNPSLCGGSPLRPLPEGSEDAAVEDTSTLFLTTITIGEISYGLRILPPGRRRLLLEQGFERVTATAFSGRILDFDEQAALRYGEVMGRRKELGRPLGILAGQIAAIARARGFAVATRNVRDVVECGVEVLNPFAPTESTE